MGPAAWDDFEFGFEIELLAVLFDLPTLSEGAARRAASS
jgi:hypothetical protein